MTLPHPDRSLENPWASWPASLPQPAIVHEVHEMPAGFIFELYEITMPNGASVRITQPVNEDEPWPYDWRGRWSDYGLERSGEASNPLTETVLAVFTEWRRQNRAQPCTACAGSGGIPGPPRTRESDGLFWRMLPPRLVKCSVCDSYGWTTVTPNH